VHQELIGLRRRHPWLHTARTTAVELQNTRAVLESRSADGTQRLRVALNLDDQPAELPVPGAAEVLAGPGGLHEGNAGLGPHGWVVVGD
jgi:cyclomaltodextrinase